MSVEVRPPAVEPVPVPLAHAWPQDDDDPTGPRPAPPRAASPPSRLGLAARLDRWFAALDPRLVLAIGLAAVLGIGLAEFTAERMALSGLYLFPVFLVAWYLGRNDGLWVAAASAMVRIGAEFAVGVYEVDAPEPYWNAAMRFLLLAAVVMLASALRTSAVKARELAHQEHEAASRLRKLNDLKDTLLHAVSHDLKGPMTVIMGATQTLRKAEDLGLRTEQRTELVDGIEIAGRKVLHLITDLLDLDRLDRGVLEPDRRPTDLAELCEVLVAEIGAEYDCPIQADLQPTVVDIDPPKVERVVENLLRNAATHTPLGTPVHVRVRPEPGGALIVVEDEGLGVPDEIKGAIFEPFAQGQQGPRAKGVGIGLSLVARFAAAHGGRAWVEDRPGGGASFRVFFPGDPRARREELEARERHPSAAGSAHLRSA
jgi:signal transduction histidine kinase